MHDKTKGVAGYTEYFCYVLSGKLTSEDGSYLLFVVLVYTYAGHSLSGICVKLSSVVVLRRIDE